MDWYALLVWSHVLLLVYWLGSDLGVFYVSTKVLDRNLSGQTRGQMARVLLDLDLVPRICLVLTLPVGVTLATWLGAAAIDRAWLPPIWLASAAWLAAVVSIHRQHGSPSGRRLARADGILRAVLIVVLTVAVAVSLMTGEPFRSAWLAAKVALYTLALACGLGIRVLLRPFGPAVATVTAAAAPGGADEDDEALLARTLRRTYPLVITIWIAIAAAAYLGIAMPS